MTSFETEMGIFFMRNCYFEKDRQKVLANVEYQKAVSMNDLVQAQETATRILENKFVAPAAPSAPTTPILP